MTSSELVNKEKISQLKLVLRSWKKIKQTGQLIFSFFVTLTKWRKMNWWDTFDINFNNLNFRLTILKKNSIDWLHYLRTTGNGLLHRIHIRIVRPAHQCARVQVQVLHTRMSTTLPQAGYVHIRKFIWRHHFSDRILFLLEIMAHRVDCEKKSRCEWFVKLI